MYTLGLSIEGIDNISSEDILKQYATNPTIGNALIAQASWMNETWLVPQEKKEEENE